MKHANSTYPVHQNPLGIQTSHSEEMLHIVAWGCTWHGCWIEGNNHKYEGRNEREKHFYINTCFNILKHHSSEECICPYISLRLLVCWLTWLVTEQHTSLQKNKTSQKHLCGCQPSGHARHRKLGLSQWSPQRRSRYSKHDFINVSSKKISMKKQKIQRP